MDFLISQALAQDGGAAPNPLASFLPLLLLIVLFYFLLIRPQLRRQKEHRQLVENLSVGDEVVTAGGILGRIIELGDQFLIVEVADGVQLRVQRHTIGGVMPKGTIKSNS